jgi:hypothetical protein
MRHDALDTDAGRADTVQAYPTEVRMADAIEAYCVKCKDRRTMQDSRVETLDNGRRAAKGVCPVCGTNMTKFLPNEQKSS